VVFNNSDDASRYPSMGAGASALTFLLTVFAGWVIAIS
jgi:hypothetical protein